MTKTSETARSEISMLMEALNQRPVAFHPIYKVITGSFSAGIVISQILYWYSRMGKPFFKTDQDFADELYMSIKEFRTAKKYLDGIPFIKTFRDGPRGRTNYEVNYDLFVCVMKNVVSRLSQTGQSVSLSQMGQTDWGQFIPNGTSCLSQTGQSLTESTSENTNTETIVEADASPDSKFQQSKQALAAQAGMEKVAAPPDERFEQFWREYPNKKKKADARKAFARAIKKVGMDKMMSALRRHKETEDWKKDRGKYIPHPTSWLNQERWDDEITTGHPKSGIITL